MGSWLSRFLKGELGWKTVAGAVIILLSVILQAIGHPEYSEYLLRFGELIGLIGLRDAIGKLPKG